MTPSMPARLKGQARSCVAGGSPFSALLTASLMTLVGTRAFPGTLTCYWCNNVEEDAMNWDRIEGNWKQFKGQIKEKWGQLTDDDLSRINGNREQLEGVIQERYGYGKDRARDEVDRWSRDLQS
jgi:uncharacterized protein YjbJ (UPF0337 family)